MPWRWCIFSKLAVVRHIIIDIVKMITHLHVNILVKSSRKYEITANTMFGLDPRTVGDISGSRHAMGYWIPYLTYANR